MSRWGEIPLPCFLPAVCLSVGPFIRRSVRLFFAPLEVLRGFQSHGGRERGISSLHGQGRPAAVLGRRQRRPWPGEGPERMRLRANWKLVFPLSLPSSPLLSAPLPLVFAQTRKPRSLPFCCLWASLPPRRPHAHGLSVRVSVHANSRPTKNNCLLTPDAASISSSLPGLITEIRKKVGLFAKLKPGRARKKINAT